MARLWISMAADGEVSEVERAALDEHLERLRRVRRVARARRGRRAARAHDPAEPGAGRAAARAAAQALAAPRLRAARRGPVAAASAAAVLGVAVAGWHSSPPAQAQSGVVRPSEIVVGWNTSGTLDGRPMPTPRTTPSRPAP